MMRIFTGANGYYIACVRPDGFHYQPRDKGSALGWDEAAAERELKRLKQMEAFMKAEEQHRANLAARERLLAAASPEVRQYAERVYPLEIIQDDPEMASLALVTIRRGQTFTA